MSSMLSVSLFCWESSASFIKHIVPRLFHTQRRHPCPVNASQTANDANALPTRETNQHLRTLSLGCHFGGRFFRLWPWMYVNHTCVRACVRAWLSTIQMVIENCFEGRMKKESQERYKWGSLEEQWRWQSWAGGARGVRAGVPGMSRQLPRNTMLWFHLRAICKGNNPSVLSH